jgi:hypothetical protein
MAGINDLSRHKQIRNLLFVLGGGIGAALAFAAAVLYFYSPSGSYLAKNMLLSSESALAMRYTEANSKTGAASRFVFDSLEFSYFAPVLKKWVRLPIDLQKYADFYALIGNEGSLVNVDGEIISLFNASSKPSTLSMKVKTESDASWQAASKTFLTVDFAGEGDYYRIALRENSSHEGWVYFYHPGIYQQILKLFVPS